MSDFIGVIYNVGTRQVKAVVNHPDDSGLDDPQWVRPTEPGEVLAMLKIPRKSREYGICPDVMSDGDCLVALRIAEKLLGLG